MAMERTSLSEVSENEIYLWDFEVILGMGEARIRRARSGRRERYFILSMLC